jgi:hypothetical protein
MLAIGKNREEKGSGMRREKAMENRKLVPRKTQE